MHMGILFAYVFVHHECSLPTDSLELELQIVESCHVGALLEEQSVLTYTETALQLQRAELFCEVSISNTS